MKSLDQRDAEALRLLEKLVLEDEFFSLGINVFDDRLTKGVDGVPGDGVLGLVGTEVVGREDHAAGHAHRAAECEPLVLRKIEERVVDRERICEDRKRTSGELSVVDHIHQGAVGGVLLARCLRQRREPLRREVAADLAVVHDAGGRHQRNTASDRDGIADTVLQEMNTVVHLFRSGLRGRWDHAGRVEEVELKYRDPPVISHRHEDVLQMTAEVRIAGIKTVARVPGGAGLDVVAGLILQEPVTVMLKDARVLLADKRCDPDAGAKSGARDLLRDRIYSMRKSTFLRCQPVAECVFVALVDAEDLACVLGRRFADLGEVLQHLALGDILLVAVPGGVAGHRLGIRGGDAEFLEIAVKDLVLGASKEDNVQRGELRVKKPGLQVFSDRECFFFCIDVEEGEALRFIQGTEEAEVRLLADIAVAYAMKPPVLFLVVRELAVAGVIGLSVLQDLRHILGAVDGRVGTVFFADGPGLISVHENVVAFVELIRVNDLQLRDLDRRLRCETDRDAVVLDRVFKAQKIIGLA